MESIKLNVSSIEENIYYAEVIDEGKKVFSADGTPDSLFYLFLELTDKGGRDGVKIDYDIAIVAFWLLTYALGKEFSRPIRRTIKSNSFQKHFKGLPKPEVITN